jgi:hypothetical protein
MESRSSAVIGDPGAWVLVGIAIAWTLYVVGTEKMSVTSEGGRFYGVIG